MTKTEKKQKAQALIMDQIAKIGYGSDYEAFIEDVGSDGSQVLKDQMDRIAKMFGYKEAWTY